MIVMFYDVKRLAEQACLELEREPLAFLS